MKTRLVVAGLWTLSLLGVAAATTAAQRAPLPGREPEVIAGPELGFRVDRYNGRTPVGELVVRRDGTWVAVEFGAHFKSTR